MKTIILLSVFLSSFSALACSCSEYPLSHDKGIVEYIQTNYPQETIHGEIEWIAYHPNLMDRLFSSGERGTSCEVEGPNGEKMSFCTGSNKSDYRVRLTNCEVIVRAKSDFKKLNVKELSSTCKN